MAAQQGEDPEADPRDHRGHPAGLQRELSTTGFSVRLQHSFYMFFTWISI